MILSRGSVKFLFDIRAAPCRPFLAFIQFSVVGRYRDVLLFRGEKFGSKLPGNVPGWFALEVLPVKDLIELFLTFAKIGVMTFGGGYAMIPMLRREVAEKKHWVSEEELLDYFAISQCTPGVFAINTATFIGHKRKGVAGGIVATAGVIFPSLIIISLLAGVIEGFSDIPWVKNAFGGIRVCVCVLILNAVVKLAKKAVVNIPTLIIFIAVTLAAFFTDLSPAIFILISAALGIALKSFERRKVGK